jgi:hypothetical protein
VTTHSGVVRSQISDRGIGLSSKPILRQQRLQIPPVYLCLSCLQTLFSPTQQINLRAPCMGANKCQANGQVHSDQDGPAPFTGRSLADRASPAPKTPKPGRRVFVEFAPEARGGPMPEIKEKWLLLQYFVRRQDLNESFRQGRVWRGTGHS